MQLPEFVFISHKEIKGDELILHTRDPYELARVLKFETDTELDTFLLKHNLHGSVARVAGYRVIICYVGTIAGYNEKIMLGHLVPTETIQVIGRMADFYNEYRVIGNESRLRKFQL